VSRASAPEERVVALDLVGIDMRFGGVHALGGADLSAREGEIVGLCGENGAGKSTLLKILSGVHPFGSYTGEVRVRGEARRFQSVADARRAGIAMVHQELMLVPSMRVADNLLLGREPSRLGVISDRAILASARATLDRFGFADEIDARATVEDLGVGLQQVVEIVRALSQDARVLVLDEPTAALTSREIDRLLGWLRELKSQGATCIYVSHKLGEVFEVCDRIVVLRDGRSAGAWATRETTPREIVAAMVGRSIEGGRSTIAAPEGAKPALTLVDLSVARPSETLSQGARAAARGVSLSVREGEIVALAGAMGSGRTAILSTIFGCALGAVSGEIRILGERVEIRSPRDAIAHGVALLPEDRKGRGLVLGMSVAENLALPWLGSREAMGDQARFGLVDDRREIAMAEARIADLSIRGAPDAPVGTLSGGNQQKVALGKWLAKPPKVLLLDEPTRGVDVGAREEIYAILSGLARRGVAVLMASSDLAEIRRIAGRVIVLRQGRIAGELDAQDATEEAIALLSTGAERGRDGDEGKRTPRP
jgi:D-xylose transport system ATP-binding protein